MSDAKDLLLKLEQRADREEYPQDTLEEITDSIREFDSSALERISSVPPVFVYNLLASVADFIREHDVHWEDAMCQFLWDFYEAWGGVPKVPSMDAYPDGCIYVIKAGEYRKIGRTKNINDRIRTLKIQLPFPVEVEAVVPCENSAASEAFLHKAYSCNRRNGEWFYMENGELEWLKDIAWSPFVVDEPRFLEDMPARMVYRHEWDAWREVGNT